MIKFFFEDTPQGQRRIIVNDLVGGLFLEEWQRSAAAGEWSWTDRNGKQKTRSLSRRLFGGAADDAASASASATAGPVRSFGTGSGIDEASSSSAAAMMQRFPPDGGVGLHVLAPYAWIPAEGAKDELSFPRGAEIREVMEPADDWFEGSYAGSKGLFPMNYVKVLGVVTM